MSKPNYGKDFEKVIKLSMEKIPDVDVQRLYDTTNGFSGIKQPADYIVYRYPHQYYIECKCVHEHNIHKSYIPQLPDLYNKSKTNGIIAGVIIWFILDDITVFIDAKNLVQHFENNKSVRVAHILSNSIPHIRIYGRKKRVFWDYDLYNLFST